MALGGATLALSSRWGRILPGAAVPAATAIVVIAVAGVALLVALDTLIPMKRVLWGGTIVACAPAAGANCRGVDFRINLRDTGFRRS